LLALDGARSALTRMRAANKSGEAGCAEPLRFRSIFAAGVEQHVERFGAKRQE